MNQPTPQGPLDLNLDDLVANGAKVLAARKAKALPKAKTLTPEEPVFRFLPMRVVHFMTQTTCDCGQVYTCPTYHGNSTFLEYVEHRVRAFGKDIPNPKPGPTGKRHYRQLHARHTARSYPNHTIWAFESMALCHACATRPVQPSLDLDDCTHVEFAVQAHYSHLLTYTTPEGMFNSGVQVQPKDVKALISEPYLQAKATRDRLIHLGLYGLIDGRTWTTDAYLNGE